MRSLLKLCLYIPNCEVILFVSNLGVSTLETEITSCNDSAQHDMVRRLGLRKGEKTSKY